MFICCIIKLARKGRQERVLEMTPNPNEPITKLTASELRNGILGVIKPDTMKFPTEILPTPLQDIIIEYSRLTGAPEDFLGGSMLTVCGTAIGNSARIEYGTFSANAVLFLCVVGRRGTGKSHPLNYALAPLKQIDKEEWKKYKQELNTWKADISLNLKSKTPEPEFPPTIVVNDSTPEALVSLHESNPRGLIIHRDELIGFIESFDRYSKTGESQKWIEIWNGSPVVMIRKSSGNTRIENPHISIIGSIQPEILPKLAGKSRVSDGFLDRLLFCNPAKCFAAPLILQTVDNSIWNMCIKKILEITPSISETGELTSRILKLSNEAQTVLSENDNRLIQLVNQSDDILSGIAS